MKPSKEVINEAVYSVLRLTQIGHFRAVHSTLMLHLLHAYAEHGGVVIASFTDMSEGAVVIDGMLMAPVLPTMFEEKLWAIQYLHTNGYISIGLTLKDLKKSDTDCFVYRPGCYAQIDYDDDTMIYYVLHLEKLSDMATASEVIPEEVLKNAITFEL